MTRQALSPAAPLASQYRDSAKLAARARLHTRYGTGGWFDWVADRLGVAAGARVLDIGCGVGWFWTQAATRLPDGLELTVADCSEGMVGEAARRTTACGRFAQVDGRVADAMALPFAEDSFDLVVAMHVLHHVPDPDRAIREMRRVLRPSGLAVVTTSGRDNLASLFRLGGEAFGGPALDPAAAVFGLEQASKALGACFERIDVARFEDVYAVSDPDDILAYLTSLPPGIDASEKELATLQRLISLAFVAGNGVLRVRREAGLLAARGDSRGD